MQRTKLTNGLLLSGVLLLSSCAQDPIPVSKQETYNRDFIKSFGVFDPNHDWNLAQHSSITVTTSAPTDIKVYADVKGVRYTFGNFTNVNGTQTLGVDVPHSVKDLIVRANGRAYTVALEGTVDIDPAPDSNGEGGEGTGTTTTANGVKLSDGSDPLKPLTVTYNTNESSWLTRRGDYVAKYGEILPEAKASLSSPDVDLNFRFHAEAGKTVTIYPAFWNTYRTNTLGIFFTSPSGQYIEQDLYTIKSDDVIEKWEFDWEATAEANHYLKSDDLKPYFEKMGLETPVTSLTDEQVAQVIVLMRADGYDIKTFDLQPDGQAKWTGTKWKNNSTSLTGGNFTLDVDNLKPEDFKKRYFVFKGFNVTFPYDVDFGMYIHNGDLKLYSESWKNNIDFTLDTTFPYEVINKERVYDTETKVAPYKPAFTATFTRDDLEDDHARRVCFEDWVQAIGDYDLNDMVFYVSGVEDRDVTIEDDPWVDNYYEWIIATEDLGDNDFDFNDVVFGVHNVKYDAATNKSTVRVRALAAGGTLPVYLYHKDYEGGQTPLQPEGAKTAEFHTGWFHGQHTSSTVVNAQSYRVVGKQMEFEVPGEFTMSCQKGVTDQNMGGFTVRVDYPNKKEYITAPNLEANIGEAPQMICVPKEWCWPKERIHILDVYEKFKEWVADADCNDWHLTPDDPSKVWARNDIPTAPGPGGNQGGSSDPSTPTTPGTLCTGTIAANPNEHSSSGVDVIYTFGEDVITDATTEITLHVSGMRNVNSLDVVKGSSWNSIQDSSNSVQVGYSDNKSIKLKGTEIGWLKENRQFTIVYYFDSDKVDTTMNPTVYIEAK